MASTLTSTLTPQAAPAPRQRLRLAPGLLLLAALAAFAAITWLVGWRQGLLWLIGLGYGLLLAAAAFGFTTGWRMWITRRDPKGLWAQFVGIAVAMLLSVPLLAAHPELQGADGPLSISLLVGAFVFGAAMQVADGCGSGTLYKAGLGHPVSLAVLPAFVLGSFAGATQLPAGFAWARYRRSIWWMCSAREGRWRRNSARWPCSPLCCGAGAARGRRAGRVLRCGGRPSVWGCWPRRIWWSQANPGASSTDWGCGARKSRRRWAQISATTPSGACLRSRRSCTPAC
jgi:uncharacterized membrane protein YedE/YeeE